MISTTSSATATSTEVVLTFVRGESTQVPVDADAWRLGPTPEQRLSELLPRGGRERELEFDQMFRSTGPGRHPQLPGDALQLRVQEHTVVSPAQPRTGVSRIGLVRRAPALTRPEFARHYLHHHVPLVMANRPLFRGYWVSLVEDPRIAWDAVVRQQFDTVASWAEHDRQVAEEKTDVREDLREFVSDLVSFEGRALT